jgi:hypothetical protein
MRKLIILTTLALIAAQAYAEDISFANPGDAYADSPTSYTSKNPKGFAEVLCFIWRLIEIICVILLIVDVISRMGGKALYFIHTSRFIIFTFGLSSLLYAGSKFLQYGTRGYMSTHLSEFIDDMYTNYFGWHLPSKVKIFNAPADGYFMFINVTFIEQCILLLLILVWGIMKVVLKKEAMMNKTYHLIKSLFLVFFISFMFPLIMWGGLWWRQHGTIGDLDEAVRPARNYFGYWVNWFFMFFWFFVALFLLYSMFKTVLDPIDGDQTVQANYEQPDFVHERNELTDAASKFKN